MQNLRTGSGLCAAAIIACSGASAIAEPTLIIPTAGVQQAITSGVNVSDFTLQKSVVQGNLGEELSLELNIEGIVHTFAMQPYSIRSESFRVITIGEDGVRREVPAPAPRTYRGFSIDGEMSISGSLFDQGFRGQIVREGDVGESWDVQPLAMAAPVLDEGSYLVYNSADSMPTGATCGGAIVAGDDMGVDQPNQNANAGQRSSFLELELVMDCDFHFYSIDNGSSTSATIADTENIIGGVSTVYERDLNITCVINEIIIRTSLASNPYTSNSAGTLLDQVRAEWIGTGGTNPRDLLHMFTGRNISGGTIGIAWLAATCSTNLGYALSESRFTSNFNNRVALTAHEIGHNLSAPHCSGGSCYIMCAGLGGCGGVSPPGVTGSGFGASSINTITSYANTRSCLDKAGPPFLDIPVFDDFASTTLDVDRWQEINGAIVNSAASNEPSAPNSLNLDGADSIITGRFDLSDNAGENLVISLYTQRVGVENGESLLLEYENISGVWQTITSWVSDGSSQSNFEFTQVQIPLLAFHSEVRFRLRAATSASNDDWYIDDFSIDTYGGMLPPFLDDFESGLDTAFTYESVSGATTNSAADNEVSGSSSLNLDSSDSVTTYRIQMQNEFPTPYWVRLYTQHKGVENGETLTVEWRDILTNWQTLGTITSDGSSQTEFDLHQFQVPDLGFHNNFSLRVSANGSDTGDDWYVDDLAVSSTFIEPSGGCNVADLAEPFDVLDFSDVVAFLGAFGGMDAAADIASPFGVWDFSDVVAFLGAFGGGCP